MPEFKKIDESSQNILFKEARTYNSWQSRDVDDQVLRDLFDLMKMAPTSMNCSPLRIVFVKSDAEKERLKPSLMDGNVEKTMAAPVTAILAADTEFFEEMPYLFPHNEKARDMFADSEQWAKSTQARNTVLQAGYFILAARSVGLDCGPMSGFGMKAVNEAFFPDGRFKVNMLCNLGYGDDVDLYPRSPRFTFDQACKII